MERERQGKNIVIAVLLVTVFCMSAAFAAFTNIQLRVDGTVNLPDAKWEVKFTAAEAAADSDIDVDPGFTDNTVTYTIELDENKTFKYTATISNDGSYTARVANITQPTVPADLSSLITQSVTGLAVGDTIAAGATKTITGTVSMGTIADDDLLAAVQANRTLTLTWIVEFEQAA